MSLLRPLGPQSKFVLCLANLVLVVALFLGTSLPETVAAENWASGQVPGRAIPGMAGLDVSPCCPWLCQAYACWMQPLPHRLRLHRLPLLIRACRCYNQQMEAAWTAQNWPLVLSLIDQMIAIDPNYDSIADRHYYAHVGYGLQLTSSSQCSLALEQFNQALQLRPDGTEALDGLALLLSYCPTPTPPARDGHAGGHGDRMAHKHSHGYTFTQRDSPESSYHVCGTAGGYTLRSGKALWHYGCRPSCRRMA